VNSIAIRCRQCNLTAAKIEGKELVVECRHYGEKHVNRFNIVELARLAKLEMKGVYVKGGSDRGADNMEGGG